MKHNDTSLTMVPLLRFRPTSPRFLPERSVGVELLAILPSESKWDREARLLVEAANKITATGTNGLGESDAADIHLALKITQQLKKVLESESDERKEISHPHLLAYKYAMDLLIHHGYILLPCDLDDAGNPKGEDLTRYVLMPTILESVYFFGGFPKNAQEVTPDDVLEMRATELGWTTLTGTPKQVAWATKIRDTALALQDPELGQALSRAHPDARWWIENREELY